MHFFIYKAYVCTGIIRCWVRFSQLFQLSTINGKNKNRNVKARDKILSINGSSNTFFPVDYSINPGGLLYTTSHYSMKEMVCSKFKSNALVNKVSKWIRLATEFTRCFWYQQLRPQKLDPKRTKFSLKSSKNTGMSPCRRPDHWSRESQKINETSYTTVMLTSVCWLWRSAHC